MQLQQFDHLLSAQGPVALVLRESLIPIGGADSPIFPPTFAAPEGSDEKPDYVIDRDPLDQTKQRNVALIDSLGSQANRMEPLFKKEPYSKLIPQVNIRIGDRNVSLLDAGHRAADAVVRFSTLAAQVNSAFTAYESLRNAVPLAKLNPTAILFGVWDSRGTQVKLPRLLSSSIRASDVVKLTRSAQYFSQLTKDEAQEIDTEQKFLSGQGLSDAPSGKGPGGVLVRGEILREAVLNLIPLRSLHADSAENTLALQRYILALGLLAFLSPAEYFLRQGCLLTANPDKPAAPEAVSRRGSREAFPLSEAEALDFAELAAAAFGVGPNQEAVFSPEAARDAKKSADTAKAAKKTKTTK